MALAFVTGGSRGLGFESAKALKELGYEVVLFARDTERLRQAGSELNSLIEFVELSDIAATRNVFKAAVDKYGIPEILMLAHGVMSDRLAKTLKATDDEWRRVMTINLDSVFTIVNEVGSKMADARNGRIIIYSACLGRMSGPGNAGGLAPYRISKAGVNALVEI